MRGDADPARVGDALAVDEDDVRPSAQAADSFDQRGPLPEGEESRDIGKPEGRDGGGFLDKLEAGERKEAGRGEDARSRKGRIDGRHKPHGLAARRQPDLFRQAFLDPAGLGHGGRPAARHCGFWTLAHRPDLFESTIAAKTHMASWPVRKSGKRASNRRPVRFAASAS